MNQWGVKPRERIRKVSLVREPDPDGSPPGDSPLFKTWDKHYLKFAKQSAAPEDGNAVSAAVQLSLSLFPSCFFI